MKYVKPVMTLADSIVRLTQKGLHIPDEVAAERFLRAVGYFRFRGYALPFTVSAPASFAYGSRQFVPGTTFAQIQDLYEFDRTLRTLVMEQVDRIEVAVRTSIVHELNTAFGPHWYLDFYRPIFKERKDQAQWFSDVAREVERSARSHQFIQHYHRKYTSPLLPPSWAIAECLSFGKWSTLYHQLAHGKGAIAAVFGLAPPVLESWLHGLNVLRNVCAHHSRLWNRSLPFEPKAHPKYAMHFVQPARFYARACVIRLMANAIDGNPCFADGLRYLFRQYPAIQPSVMGFPAGWDNDPLWQP